jgi:hypothetical protein
MNDFVFGVFLGVPGWGGHVPTVLTIGDVYASFYRALIVFILVGVLVRHRSNL